MVHWLVETKSSKISYTKRAGEMVVVNQQCILNLSLIKLFDLLVVMFSFKINQTHYISENYIIVAN